MYVVERLLEISAATFADDNGARTTNAVPWDEATTYGLADLVTRGVMIDDGGASVTYWYRSLTAANDADPAADDQSAPTAWRRIVPEYLSRMFDRRLSSAYGLDPGLAGIDSNMDPAPEGDLTITFDNLSVGRVVNAVWLGGVANASAVRVQVYNAGDTEVYDRSVSMIDTENVTNFYEFVTFSPEDYVTGDALFWDVPGYPDYKIVITATALTGTTVQIGEVFAGNAIQLGTTLDGTEGGFDDYSRVDRNAFGDVQLVQQGYSKSVKYRWRRSASRQAFALRIISRNRAIPQLWVGRPDLPQVEQVVLGFPAGRIRFPFTSGQTMFASLEIQSINQQVIG